MSRSPAHPRPPLQGPGSRSHQRGQTLHRAPTDCRLREDVHHDTGSLKCSKPAIWPEPSASFVHHARQRHDHRCLARTGCAPADPARAVGRPTCTAEREATVIRVDVEQHPSRGCGRRRRCGCGGRAEVSPNLERCWRAYRRRLDSEHTSGRPRPPPGWITASLCKPEQRTVGPGLYATYTQLRLARGRVVDPRPPGERPAIPNNSPQRARRGFADFVQRSALGPSHRNTHRPSQDGPKGLVDHRGPLSIAQESDMRW